MRQPATHAANAGEKTSLSPGYLREFSKRCEKCEQFVQQIDTVSSWGATFRGGNLRIDWLSPALLKDDEAEFASIFTAESLSVVKGDKPIDGQTYESVRLPSSGVILLWNDARQIWLMNQLELG